MNINNLQQQLLQQEVTPPKNSWEKIVIALDELDADQPLQQKILAAQLIPPSNTWEEINQRLHETSTAAELLQSTVDVPADAWDKINQQLDKEADKRMAAQLQEATVATPAFVWNAIEAELNRKEAAKVIRLKPIYKQFFQYAAAAAITGVLAWGAYRLFNQNAKEAEPIIAVADPAKKESQQQEQIKTELPKQVAEVKITQPAPVAASSKMNVRKRVKEILHSSEMLAIHEVKNHSFNSSVITQTIHHRKPETNTSDNGFSENQYFVVLNDNGDLVRVTKRINNMKCVKADDVPVDAATALNSRDCNDQIKKWQEQMALSTSLATSSGILDITEVIKTTDK